MGNTLQKGESLHHFTSLHLFMIVEIQSTLKKSADHHRIELEQYQEQVKYGDIRLFVFSSLFIEKHNKSFEIFNNLSTLHTNLIQRMIIIIILHE